MTPEQIAILSDRLKRCPTVGRERVLPNGLASKLEKALAEFEQDKRRWVEIPRMEM